LLIDRVEVPFLGKQCFLQCGIAELAVPTRALVVPVINYKDGDGNDVLKIEQPIDAKLQPGENRHLAVERVTKGIALYM
jgi:lauroyl/myristoyl acyltransferase